MNTALAKKNVITSILYQLVTVAYGLIVPRLVLSSFGSEVNGLTSSLSQFLNYISLLEGGLSGVIMAALYKPLANKDYAKVSGVIKAADNFFKKIALIFVVYTFALATIYPFVVSTSFSWGFIFSLTIIISTSLFIQYFFSLSYRLLINADQKGYIVFSTLIIFTILNFLVTLIVIKVCPEIHILKAASAIVFIVQPIAFNRYVKKNYKLDKNAEPDEDAIAQRWDGFGQNIAFFIHSNTDVVVLTIFSTLSEISVYSVYMLVVTALRTLVTAISSSLAPSLGNSLAKMSNKEANELFDSYEFGLSIITTFAFTCGALLVTPFIQVYTRGVTDANYYQPLFGYLMMAAEAVYCFRDPYVTVAYVSGKYKGTAKYAYVEAVLNIIISVILVLKFGLIGVAVGTLLAMTYRMIAHMIYIAKNLFKRELKQSLKCLLVHSMIAILSAILVTLLIRIDVQNYFDWIIEAVATVAVVVTVMIAVLYMTYRKQLCLFTKRLVHKHK